MADVFICARTDTPTDVVICNALPTAAAPTARRRGGRLAPPDTRRAGAETTFGYRIAGRHRLGQPAPPVTAGGRAGFGFTTTGQGPVSGAGTAPFGFTTSARLTALAAAGTATYRFALASRVELVDPDEELLLFEAARQMIARHRGSYRRS